MTISPSESPRPGLSQALISRSLRTATLVHALVATGYWIIQPRGFELGSRGFLEHQVLAPALAAVSWCTVYGWLKNRTLASIGTGILAGFWIPVWLTLAVVGNTRIARFLMVGLGIGFVVLAAGLWHRRQEHAWRGVASGLVFGAGLGASFLFCSWAPAATTRPSGGSWSEKAAVERASSLEGERLQVKVVSDGVYVDSAAGTVTILPAFGFHAASKSGFWTLFDYYTERVSAWQSDRLDERTLLLRADTARIRLEVVVRLHRSVVELRCTTEVREEIKAHLAEACRILVGGEVRVGDRPWKASRPGEPVEFLAFRDGKLELLRAAKAEKGPFERLQALPSSDDPVIQAGPWTFQVSGWTTQASQAPSPTAGWGVSQGTIERLPGELIWSLATTSVGRGWHTVRTGPGIYTLVIRLTLSP